MSISIDLPLLMIASEADLETFQFMLSTSTKRDVHLKNLGKELDSDLDCGLFWVGKIPSNHKINKLLLAKGFKLDQVFEEDEQEVTYSYHNFVFPHIRWENTKVRRTFCETLTQMVGTSITHLCVGQDPTTRLYAIVYMLNDNPVTPEEANYMIRHMLGADPDEIKLPAPPKPKS